MNQISEIIQYNLHSKTGYYNKNTIGIEKNDRPL